jgi:organic hydroperoxide reductase OsmC/OhrA
MPDRDQRAPSWSHQITAAGDHYRRTMTHTHTYAITTTWTGNRGEGTAGYRAYGRDHDLAAEGRPTLPASSDPAFRGDAGRWNPELLLVAALSDCHLLAYLHLCAVSGVVVTAYRDEASGVMEQVGDGGRFTEVVLRPVVTVAEESMIALANALHHEAHANCFIASSVSFEVRTEPVAHADQSVDQRRASRPPT